MAQPDGAGPALESYQKAVELREEVAREHPELADQAYLLAMDLGDLNVAQQMAGKLDSALKGLRRAVEVLERLDRQYPGVLNYQGGLASTYNLMSDLHRRRREPAESLAFAEKARALLDRLVAEHPEGRLSPASTWPRPTTTSAGCTSSRAIRPRPCDRSSAPSTCTRACPSSTRATATTWRATWRSASP